MSKHGMVKAVGTHFEYEDGTYYYPFGTTIYALAHQEEELIEETFKTLANAPFNKVRMCVFPKHYQYNNNEPQYYPFEKDSDGNWDVEKPDDRFWNHLEGIIKRLDDMEIECDLILFHSYDNWGFATMSMEDNLKYLDYCMKRLGKNKNIWWSLANEYDFLLSVISMEDWYEIEEFVASHNTEGHLISNHNCFLKWDVSRKNITHGSYQIKDLSMVADEVIKFGKPIVVDECCYEGDLPESWGCLSAQEMTARFWQAVASGSYCTHGETFLDDTADIIWWAKGGRLKGESPKRIRFLREIIEALPGPLYPHISTREEYLDNLPEDVRNAITLTPAGKSFAMAKAKMPANELVLMQSFGREYMAKCANDEAILVYYYRRCSRMNRIGLPEGKEYRIDVIDTWNMTRETVPSRASGVYEVKLPGKEFMAVIATECEQ